MAEPFFCSGAARLVRMPVRLICWVHAKIGNEFFGAWEARDVADISFQSDGGLVADAWNCCQETGLFFELLIELDGVRFEGGYHLALMENLIRLAARTTDPARAGL